MKASVIGVAILILSGCASNNRMYEVRDKNLIDIKQDQDEYEVIVLDSGFDTWFQTTWSPAKDRSLAYYKNWNQQYVSAWNYKAAHPSRNNFFDTTIQYDPATAYGMEVERKLYYYFRWVDTKLKIPILDTPPPATI